MIKVPSEGPARWIMLVVLMLLPLARSFGASAIDLNGGKFDARSQRDRQQIARDLLQKIQLLDSFLPTIKPSEALWLSQERAAIDRLEDSNATYSRLKNLVESPEFYLQKLKLLLDKIKRAISCAVQEKIETKQEMLCWLMASFHLSDRSTINDAMMILIRNGRLPKDIGKKSGLFCDLECSDPYEWFARGIQEYIVIPYFAGTLE